MALRHAFRKWKKSKSSDPSNRTKRRGRGFVLSHAIESLEPRQLLTVLVGGDTFEFRNQAGLITRVKLFGNITAEMIGAVPGIRGFEDQNLPGLLTHSNGTTETTGYTPTVFLGNPPQPPVMGIQTTSGVLADVFTFYVADSDITGEITVATTPDLTVPNRPMQPFNGSIGSIKTTTLASIAAPGGTGQAILGTRIPQGNNPPGTPDRSLTPITTLTLSHTYPLLPLGIGSTLSAGLMVGPGQTMGRFLFGGTVLGSVRVQGSINTFYCGWLLTGDAGNAGYGTVTNPQNFRVDGDIRSLIVKGGIGADTVVTGPTGIAQNATGDYASGFDMYVGGSLGVVRTGDSLLGNVRVAHAPDPTVPLLGIQQYEDETRSDGLLQDAGFFSNYPFAQANPALPGVPGGFATTYNFAAFDPFDVGLLGGDAFVQNDTFDTAQYLGSLPTTVGGKNSAISVNGVLEAARVTINGTPVNDFTDYYAVPLMAGQTITVQLTIPASYLGALATQAAAISQFRLPLDVGVFDPDGRLIATDINNVDPSQTQGKPFRITTDRPGIYRFAIAEYLNSEFSTNPSNSSGAFTPYNLTVQGVGDLALGAIVANRAILDDNLSASISGIVSNSANGPSFLAGLGDFGALKAGGAIISNNISDTISVPDGDLRVVEGASIGTGTGPAAFTLYTGVDVQVPRGSVGLVNASGTPTPGTAAAGGAALPAQKLQIGGQLGGPNASAGGTERLGSTYPGGAMFPGAGLSAASPSVTHDGLLMFNYGFGFGGLNPLDFPAATIGGDVQVVSAETDLSAKLYTAGSIGTVRCGAMDVPGEPSYFRVNVNNSPAIRGTIDLIESQGDLGTLADGGPRISTGPRGDVRYIKALGNIFRDPAFGLGSPNSAVYSPGASVTIQDDSGASLTFTPEPQRPDPNNPATILPAGQLAITTYPIEGTGGLGGGGGSVVVDVRVSSSLTVTSTGDSLDDVAEIGRIEFQGIGTPVINSTSITPVLKGGSLGQVKQQPPAVNPGGGATGPGTAADGSLLSTTVIDGGTEFKYALGSVYFVTAQARTVLVPGTQNSTAGAGLFGTLVGQTNSAGSIVFTFSDGTTVTLNTTSGATSIVAGVPAANTPPAVPGPAGLAGLQLATGGEPLFLRINGTAEVDVLNTIVTNNAGVVVDPTNQVPLPSTMGNATEISNNTGGEMVSIAAESIGTLFSSGTLGLAKHHTAAGTLPAQTLIAGNLFAAGERVVDPTASTTPSTLTGTNPFVQDVAIAPYVGDLYPFGYGHQTYGIEIMHGNILTVQAQSLGNFLVDGSIGQVTALGGGEGIAAPIFAFNLSNADTLATHKQFAIQNAMNGGASLAGRGRIGSINIGGGVQWSGSGYVSQGGIYTESRVGPISGSGSDIRGDIISETGIDGITLHNGSIIDANIGNFTDPAMGMELPQPLTIPDVIGPIDAPTLDLGNVAVAGNGGIIGTSFNADHVGSLIVSNGFGIVESHVGMLGDGTVNTIRADGYGLRGNFFDAGANLGHLIASGNGGDSPVTNYSTAVRLSDTYQWDPFTGFAPNQLTDLEVYLNRATPAGGPLVTPSTPSQPGITDTGIIEDTTAIGSRDLGTVQAFIIRDKILNIFAVTSTLHDTLVQRLDFGNSIGTLQTTSVIDGLEITTGRITKVFRPGSDVSRLSMTVAGNVKSIVINGSLLNGSTINASGVNGNISSVKILGDLNGTIEATRRIAKIFIAGNLVGDVGGITGNVLTGAAIGKLTILGRVLSGTFTINGNLTSLIMPGDLGAPGETFIVHGSVGSIKLGGNYNVNTTIEGTLKTLKIGGSVTTGTSISIAGALTTLQVGGDIQAGATITANPLPPIKKRKIGGQVLGTLVG